MPLNILAINGRTTYSVNTIRTNYSVGSGKSRNTSGSMNRVLGHCNSTSPDLNVAFNCAFKTQYFSKPNLVNIFNTTTANEILLPLPVPYNNGTVNILSSGRRPELKISH